MDTSRIAVLLQPFVETPLHESQLHQISTYIDILLRWNSRINLTAIRDPEEIVTRHFGESFFMARHLFPSGVARTLLSANPDATPVQVDQPHPLAPLVTVLDIGSGAGFPGLPIKLWAPDISLTLVESNHKKATFLRELSRALTLTDINVTTARAETLTTQSDVVTLRAVDRFETIVPIAASLVAPAGRLALLISSKQIPTLNSVTSFRPSAQIPLPSSNAKVLSIMVLDRKVVI
ncbi:MAG: 16S rRNA (guanine(527)-N(7))-methyltransferase RsmG [Acidobacteria bacterium]|jgi:16S rRNA (guanine527-N7)-methyltransferase|nr:MAG: 16S rRNA (guanine(527)-N(7))-methyltransferase RsmG [Acidobacteriota bacterium]